MDRHIEILGWLYIGLSVFGLLTGGLIFIILCGVAALPDVAYEAATILGLVGVSIGFFFAILSAPGIIGGIGLLKRQNWARILVIVLGFINLINFPFGTALGIYTLFVLLKEETTAFFNNTRTGLVN